VQYGPDEERVIHLGPLRAEELRAGDNILLETRSGYACELLPKGKVEEALLEEVPDVTYEDIGGLDAQIEAIKDGIELPYLFPAEFAEHCLCPPKGILLYGPPGCGKTLIAKAVANNLARALEERTGEKTTSYFLNIKGPELLNKYVGETERRIREIFKRAKERANERTPVIIFFDEMDSLFRLRGSGISSDVEITVVSQFLAEIDGLEALANVIVIGASNRQDLIDPAVLRPGRLDLKIKIDRPDQEAAKDIFSKYLTPDLPLHKDELAEFGNNRDATVRHLIELAVKGMYAETSESQFLEVTYARGQQEVLYFKDFASGAMMANVVSRAKKIALKRYIWGGEKGICRDDLYAAIGAEFKENEELPNTANPDDWSRLSGRQGDKIVNVRILQDVAAAGKKGIEDVTAGQYL
jgi:proteasome-associated ATPase